ncbi:MAG: NAD(P)-dependent glycerol-1-phosphate dehydrogenase [Thermoplasmata archaeon]|jgi:glycerol-1-phosphate dehydrogenase [NAD(P)+]|nr:NAD(P)-dependent glycerol-1-phosphate dehydrogenase [Thermoplasmata archaeon]MVT13231.1 NAD(P)-dependent glycerol-1-phosphate dehydrogenase [Euryarchaeota archaeon]MVT14712.1 NAD(P)-dependent glycerol-1-phosphate dehydrogenase [Euryarchaeota archaeon]MVT35952.1 NAD(P)-dependent glycerol-1-phosphate dehydrogenase [Euryarchaeota archaeon]
MSFNKVKKMELPRIILAGHGVIEKIGEVLNSIGHIGKILIVTGPKTYEVAGKNVESIISKNYDVETFITGDATIENVNKVKDKTKEEKIKLLMGIGGGTKIDIAKKAAYDLSIPFISIPTSASHDGVASPRATIKDSGGTVSSEASVPISIIADTAIIVKAPYRYLIAGAADIIANYTAIRDWELAYKLKGEDFSSSAYAISKYTAEEMLNYAPQLKPNDEESVWVVVKAIISSGMAMSLAGSSRPASGSEHLFTHAVEMIAPGRALHGEIAGVGTIIMSFLQGQDWKRVREALRVMGAPTKAKEIGLTPDEAIRALTIAHTVRNRYTILGESGISAEAAEKALRATEVI